MLETSAELVSNEAAALEVGISSFSCNSVQKNLSLLLPVEGQVVGVDGRL